MFAPKAYAVSLRDRLEATDPGQVRLRLALRTTATVAVSFAILSALARAFGWPPSVPLFGAVLGMSWSMSVNDLTSREQRITTLILWIPTAVVATLGTLTRPHGIASDAAFLAILFAAFAVRSSGQRWIAVGFLSIIAFFLTWFLQIDFDQLPRLLAALSVTMLVTYGFRFFVFRDRPRNALLHGLRAFRARTRLIAQTIAVAAERGAWTPRLRRRLDEHVLRLNFTALVLDDILRAVDDSTLRAAVLEAEISVEALAEVAGNDCRSPDVTVRLHEAADDVGRLLERAAALDGLETAWAPRSGFRVATQIDAGRLSPSLRQAVQVTAASALAIAAGELISATRWYWAVLAAFVVFAGTSSSGETLNRAWGRAGGTALGILAGIAVERLVHGNAPLSGALIFVLLFAAVYVFRIWYAAMVFCVTAILSVMYGLLGLFSDQLLIVRLEETAAGALIGAIAAVVLLPIHTRHVIANIGIEALLRLRTVVNVAVDRLLGAADADPTPAMRAFDEVLQTVRAQRRSTLGPVAAGNQLARARLGTFAACGFYARNLTADAMRDGPLRSPDELRGRRERIVERIDALIAFLRGDLAIPAGDAGARPPDDDAPALDLYRLDRALRHLARILELVPRNASAR